MLDAPLEKAKQTEQNTHNKVDGTIEDVAKIPVAFEEEQQITETVNNDINENVDIAENADKNVEDKQTSPLSLTDAEIEKLNPLEITGTEYKEDAEDNASESENETKELDKESLKTAKDDTQADIKKVSEINYKAEYEKLTAPFRANNAEMQINNVDDAITLMKMGANYNKKMHGLKPHMKIIKMLENNDLLDEDKLNFLIDLEKHDPNAITKLIKDAGIDPLDVDTTEDSTYQPTNHTVSNAEAELDTVLEDIKETPAFNKTMDILGNQWDDQSKEILFNQPDIIKVINDHINNGVYDEIATVITRERALGRLNGVSDFDAYRTVGESLQNSNGFKSQQKANANTNANLDKTVNKAPDPELKNRKKAASSPRSNSNSTVSRDNFSPLSLSDEDFEKVSTSKYLR